MKRKVLILYPSASAACGIGTWVDAISLSLKEHSWDVTVGLAWGVKFHDPARVELFRPALKTIRMDGRTGTEEGRIQAIKRAVLAVEPDVVIVNVLDNAFEAARRLRYRGHKFRLIALNHGNLPGHAACLFQNRDVIDMAVCVSRLSYKAMAAQDGGFSPERLRHVANAVAIPGASSQARKHPFRVGYAGRLDTDKRGEDIVPFFTELHDHCPETQMWVAGKGKCEAEIQAIARTMPDHFRYFGELSKAELDSRFYQELDVLVHFSPSESWGYSIAEAMSFGVVPVTSAFRGVFTDGLVLKEKNALVFPVGDIAQAVELVAGLYESRETLKRMSQSASQHIADCFSLSLFGQAWSDLLNECLNMASLPSVSRPVSLDTRGPGGLPWPLWEKCRRLLGRSVTHASIGAEWPHYRCTDRVWLKRMKLALSAEEKGNDG